MPEPYLGELTFTAFDFAPKGFALCNGALLPINQNQALFSLLGTMYGGDGRTTFALPDLRGRVPIHVGDNFDQGSAYGQAAVPLADFQMPTHTHELHATSADGNESSPQDHVLAGGQIYHEPGSAAAMAEDTVATEGRSEPHENMQPYTVINCCIAVQGVFPSRN